MKPRRRQNPPVRRNSDERRRDLERRAAQGDLGAQAALATSQLRAGVVTPPSHQLTDAGESCHGCEINVATGESEGWGDPQCDTCREIEQGLRSPRLNPGDERLRALERDAARGDPQAQAALDVERRRRGLPTDERRQYVADLTAQVAEELRNPGTGINAARNRANIAKAIRAVLKSEKISGVSVTTPRYRGADSIVVGRMPGHSTLPGVTWVALLRLFHSGEAISAMPQFQTGWRPNEGFPATVQRDLQLFVNDRALGEPEDPMNPAMPGPTLPWWAANVYRHALRAAVTGAKPLPAFSSGKSRLACAACGRRATALWTVQSGGEDALVCARCHRRWRGL